MKLTKSELKSVIKECLIEILSEGIEQTVSSIPESKTKKPLLKSNSVHPHISTVLRQNASRVSMQQSNALKEAIKIESGGNDVMASILADTAAKSLPTMLESDRPGAVRMPTVGTAENIVAATQPEDLFGEEASSKWASLAFGIPKK